MATTEVDFENNSKVIDVTRILRADVSRSLIKLSIILGLMSLLPVNKIEKSSKDGELLQNKSFSRITVSLLLSIFTFFTVKHEMPNCSPNQTLK